MPRPVGAAVRSRNHDYLLERFERLQAAGPLVGLDFGCGAGDLVAEARRRGYEFWGADTYRYGHGAGDGCGPESDAEPFVRRIGADGSRLTRTSHWRVIRRSR